MNILIKVLFMLFLEKFMRFVKMSVKIHALRENICENSCALWKYLWKFMHFVKTCEKIHAICKNNI